MKYIIIAGLVLVFHSCKTDRNIEQNSWRGEQNNGIFHETNLMEKWPDEGPEEVLFIENIGNGYGSPAISDDKIYVTGEIDSIAVLFCFDLKGEIVWKTNLGPEWTENFPGSRSAPTLADELIYIGTGIGNLFCINSVDGSVNWTRDFNKDFRGQKSRFGHSESALINGDQVFWVPGGTEHNVVSLNRFTGDVIWSQKAYSERSAYNSPTLIELPGRKILCTFTAYHLLGIDAETGDLLWSHEQENYPVAERENGKGDVHSNSVIFDDGFIYYVAGDGNGGVKLALSEDGSSITELWKNEDLDGYMGGIIKIGDVLFCDGTRKKDLKAINAENGNIIDNIKIGSGVLVWADEMLYFYSQKGELMLISYQNGSLGEVSSFKVKKGTKEHFSHPVIKNGILYLRHGNVMMGYRIS